MKFLNNCVGVAPGFTVEPSLLEMSREGDSSAQFQIGLQALTEKRFGYAMAFFRLAHQGGHSDAIKYLDMTNRELEMEMTK